MSDTSGPSLDADEALAEHRRRVVAASKLGAEAYAEALRELARVTAMEGMCDAGTSVACTPTSNSAGPTDQP